MQGNPFRRTTIIIMFVIGFAAFIALLYGLGSGDRLMSGRNGQAHGASNSIVGYKALADLLTRTGTEVEYSRSPAGYDDAGLLVLTPNPFMPAGDIDDVIQTRAYIGPTMIILPKWQVMPSTQLQRGWVHRFGIWDAETFETLVAENVESSFAVTDEDKEDAVRGAARSAVGVSIQTPERPVTMEGERLRTIVRDERSGQALASYVDDGGVYAQLDALDPSRITDEEEIDTSFYPVVIVADADLLNNGGLSDRQTARHALALVKAASAGSADRVIFDLTFNGLGGSENLLTLAFEPPFLSATICLVIAALAAAWMAFNRFGPPRAEQRAIDFGKTALIDNSAGFVDRMRRSHLAALPYAEMMRADAMRAVGLGPGGDREETNRKLDRLGDYQGQGFSQLYQQLAQATKPQEIAEAAAALHAWKEEKTR